MTSSENTSFARSTLLRGIIRSALRISRKYTKSCFRVNLSTHHEATRGHEDTAPRILNIDTRQRRMISIEPIPLHPGTLDPCTHQIVGRVGPVVRPGTLEDTDIACPCQKSKQNSPVIELV